ncbi:MAG: alpha/beta fold hydrolase [Pseudomonadota bacterium]
MIKTTYANNKSWPEINAALPQPCRLTDAAPLTEETFAWQGHAIHLDRFVLPNAPFKVLLTHGVAGNARLLSGLIGAPLYDRGVESVAMDFLGLGETHTRKGHAPSYKDWVEQTKALIVHEAERDNRPLIVFGFSTGGMVAYEAIAQIGGVSGLAGNCFIDTRNIDTVKQIVRTPFIASMGPFQEVVTALAPGLKAPIRAVVKAQALCNKTKLQNACLRDRTGLGAWVTNRFLLTLSKLNLSVEPEDFDKCPILLTAGNADRWTPEHLSRLFLDRAPGTFQRVERLSGTGHLPDTESAVEQLAESLIAFAKTCIAR